MEDWRDNLDNAFDRVTASVLYKEKERLEARVKELEQELDEAREEGFTREELVRIDDLANDAGDKELVIRAGKLLSKLKEKE